MENFNFNTGTPIIMTYDMYAASKKRTINQPVVAVQQNVHVIQPMVKKQRRN